MKRLLALSLVLPGLALAQGSTDAAVATDASAAKPAVATTAAPAASPASTSKPAAKKKAAPQRDAEEEAGDVAEIDKDARGPLRERIRPVSGQLYVRKNRLEITPSAAVTFRDAFFRKYILGGSLTYYPAEWLGFNAYGGYSIPTVAGTAQQCDTNGGGCAPPTFADLDGPAPGQIKLVAGADVMWSPIYGKMSLLAESFVHFDLYLLAGAAGVQYGAPLPRDETQPELNPGSVETWTVGGNVGLGGHLHFNRHMAVRLELRDLIYQEKGENDTRILNHQFLFNLGLSFFL